MINYSLLSVEFKTKISYTKATENKYIYESGLHFLLVFQIPHHLLT